MFSREESTTTNKRQRIVATCHPPRFSLSLSLAGYKFMKVQLPGNLQGLLARPLGTLPNRSFCLPLRPARGSRAPSSLLPLPVTKKKKEENQERKNLAASLPRATWLVARVFFPSPSLPASRRGLPYYTVPSPFFRRFLKSWIPPPLSTSIGPTSGKTEVSGDQGNEFSCSFFFYARARTFSLSPRASSPPFSVPFGWRSASGAQCEEKKFH
jgi:hypothetical protein